VPQDHGPEIQFVNLLKPQHKVELLLCLMVPDMGKHVALSAGFLALPACPSDNSSKKGKVIPLQARCGPEGG